MPEKQLTVKESQLATRQDVSVGELLQGALSNIQNGQITPEHVDVLGKMMELYERNDKRQSEKEFAAALTSLQGETIRIVATKKVDPKSDGSCRYKFAPYEEIMEKVQPMLTKHGFSITFDTEMGETRLTSICMLTHESGHSRSNKFSVRYGKPPGSSDAQGDMSTKSYAKRGALCDALNISIDHDTDARAEGSPISTEAAGQLKARVDKLGVNEDEFLKYARASDYSDIHVDRLDELDTLLFKKEVKAGIRDQDGNWKF